MANRSKRNNDIQGQIRFLENDNISSVQEDKPVGLKGTAVDRITYNSEQAPTAETQYSESRESILESGEDMDKPHVLQSKTLERDGGTSVLSQKSTGEVVQDQSEPPAFQARSIELDETTSSLRRKSTGEATQNQSEPPTFQPRTLKPDETMSELSQKSTGEVVQGQSEPPAFLTRSIEHDETTSSLRRKSTGEAAQNQDELPTVQQRTLNPDESTSRLSQERSDNLTPELSKHEQTDEELKANTIFDERVGGSTLWEYIFSFPIEYVNRVLAQFGLNWEDYERESKKRFDGTQHQKEFDGSRSTRREQERQSRERSEQERRDKKRREKERKEKERIEGERKEKELIFYKNFENDIFECSEYVPAEDNLYFCLFSEKKQGNGEDSKPLIFKSKRVAHVGVFDGMGGAGATEYQTYTIGSKTGAFLASRAIRACCLNYLSESGNIASPEHLAKIITVFLNKLTILWNIRPSGLRSSVIRVLPTTLAIVEATQIGDGYFVSSYWAGDSRNYILTSKGLQQISIDDLRQQKDPLENLRSDDALSNCVCQDKQFVINVKKCGKFDEPIIILSATDGCFGYLPTPMHFEFILLDTMMKSENCNEWCQNIKNELDPLSGDDFSIGLQILGGDFFSWKDSLFERYQYLKTEVIDPINQMKTAHEKAIRECEETKERLNTGITELWERYKHNYMSNSQSH